MTAEDIRKRLRDLETFLRKYYRQMPRTMLRYAIERFPADKRELFMRGRI